MIRINILSKIRPVTVYNAVAGTKAYAAIVIWHVKN
nr:MAG TPA: hypothetical protein [Caudoviricetes sp.]